MMRQKKRKYEMMTFETKVRVQYYETDNMGIVHHSNYIRYFETARTEMFRMSGYSYDDMEKSGIYAGAFL